MKNFGAFADPVDEVLPLPIYPWPVSAEDMAAVKQAKLDSGLSFKVMPRPAVPGSPGRILALRKEPHFLTVEPFALVADPSNAAGMLAAMRFVYDPNNDDPRGRSALTQLRAIFGKDVKEIGKEQLALENVSVNLDLADRKVEYR